MAAWAIAGWEVARADAPPTLSAPARPATPQDLRARADWPSRAWQTPPFSFTLGGKSSADLLPHWKRDRTDRALAGRGVEHTTTWVDPTGGLEVQWVLIRLMPPRAPTAGPEALGGRRVVNISATTPADPRLPSTGTAITRQYKGRSIRVVVQADGFEYEGDRYKTLTAVAEHITGSHINGYRFFRLEGRP